MIPYAIEFNSILIHLNDAKGSFESPRLRLAVQRVRLQTNGTDVWSC